MSTSDIKKSGGRLRGRPMAAAGIVFGLIGCLGTFAFLIEAARRLVLPGLPSAP